MTADPALRRWQLRVVGIAWLTYAGYYLGRVNLAAALPGLRGELGLSAQTAGGLASGFFLSYAAGQLVSGWLGDRVSPRRLVVSGLLISAGLNAVFGFLSETPPLLLVWTANGFFQALGWAPILRLLANWHDPAARRRLSGPFATSFVAGSAATLVLTGWLAGAYGWRWAFWLPAALMGLLALAWYLGVRDAPAEVGLEPPSRPAETSREPAPNPLRAFVAYGPVTLASGLGGFLLFALVVWTPSLLVDTLGLGVGAASRLAALLPVAGIVGTLGVGGWIARRGAGREAAAGAYVLFALAGLVVLVPVATTTALTGLTLLVLVGAAAYAASSVLLSTLPLVLSRRDETASVAAGIDVAFNIGASFGGALVGAIVDRAGWGIVFVVLMLAAGIGGSALLLVGRTGGTGRSER